MGKIGAYGTYVEVRKQFAGQVFPSAVRARAEHRSLGLETRSFTRCVVSLDPKVFLYRKP